LGEQVEWAGARAPGHEALEGRTVVLRPLDPGRDAEALFRHSHEPDGDPGIWHYLMDGPFDDAEQLRATLAARTRPIESSPFGTMKPLASRRRRCWYEVAMMLKARWRFWWGVGRGF